MEKLHNGFTLELCSGAFPLSTDAVALAGFVKLSKNATVLDLGAGCGTLGTLLCAKYADCQITGIEIRSEDHAAALRNAEHNNIAMRLKSICADVEEVPTFIPRGSFSACISNPPYFTGGPRSTTAPIARREDLLPLDVLFASAAWALRYGGDFFIVHRPERLAQICTIAAHHALEPKRLRLLRHKKHKPVSLILVQCRKGGKPGLIWEDAYLFEEDGTPSPYYKEIYHIQEAEKCPECCI